jgi:hypothetical protein
MIKLLRGVLSPNILRFVCFGKFQSLLKYGIIFWGVVGDSKKVFKIQKRVLRIMSGLGKQESCRHIFKEYGILTVTSLYILEVLCYIKKHKGDLIQNINIRGCPELRHPHVGGMYVNFAATEPVFIHCSGKFPHIHNYNTRLNKDYHINFCRTTLFKRIVVNMRIELYSRVPNKIKNMEGFFNF